MNENDILFASIGYDKTTDILRRARSFVERGWCRHCYAADASGRPVAATVDGAVAWCAVGAIMAATAHDPWIPDESDAPYARLAAVIGGNIGDFNDAQETVEPVLAAFDRAIATRAKATTPTPTEIAEQFYMTKILNLQSEIRQIWREIDEAQRRLDELSAKK